MKNLNTSIVIAIILFISIILIIGFAILYYYHFTENEKIKIGNNNIENFEKKEVDYEKIIDTKKECAEGWAGYNHNVIGVSFCYPEKWGIAKTSPKIATTRLSDVVSELGEHNYNYNAFHIEFENKNEVKMKFVNEKYGGERYPNSYAYQYGYINNIGDLKLSGDICDYKIDFNHSGYQDKLNEIYNDCDQNIKTSIIENYRYFNFIDDSNKSRYSYDLKSYAFKKLSNGYFDNLLISYRYGHISQNKKELENLSEVLNSLEKTESEFDLEKEEFKNFIESVKVYKPVSEKFEEFKIVEGEEAGMTAIKKYYWLLSNNRIKEAYQLRLDQDKISYEKFQDWYKNINFARPHEFKKKNSETYEFYVEYQDHNTPITKYRVEMSFRGGKIETMSSIEILTKEVFYGDYSAYAYRRGDKNYMILAKDGKEAVIDKGGASYDSTYSNIAVVKFFRDISFSPGGNYLLYEVAGWEWASTKIYDIQNKTNRILMHKEFSPSYYGFTDNEDYFYECDADDMSGIYFGKVYKIPEFDLKYELPLDEKAIYNISCEYNKNDEIIRFNFSKIDPINDLLESKIIEYSVITGKIKEK